MTTQTRTPGPGPPRVVLAVDWFLRLAVPHAVALRGLDVEVALVHRDHAMEFGGMRAELDGVLAVADQAGVLRVPVDGRVRAPAGVLSAVRAARRLRAWRPDVVHAHENGDPRLFGVTGRTPCLLTVHDPSPHPGAADPSTVARIVGTAWRRRAAVLTVHGEALKRELAARHPAKRIEVLAHGVSVCTRPLPIPERPTVLLFGRLEPYKGIDVLLAAMETVWTVLPGVRLLVVGDGPAADGIAADERVDFRRGYWPEHRVPELLAEATVVVLPYTQGSQSGVGSLAVGAGVPVVTTAVGSLPDLVPDASFVVRPADVGALADALVVHLRHGASERERVRAHAAARLSWPEVARRSLDLYRTVA